MAGVDGFHFGRGYSRAFQAAILLGAGTLVFGFWQAPQQTWANLLLISLYLLGLGAGGLVWLSLHYLTGARWSESLKAVPLAMATVLPAAAVGLLAVLLGQPSLYHWDLPALADPSASPLRQVWFNRPFFLLRTIVYVGSWLLFAFVFLKNSRSEGLVRSIGAERRPIALSGAFLVVFGVTCWLASHDWIMSLEPEWTSTIFGVYNFGGLFVSSLAAVIVIVLWRGSLRDSSLAATENQLHDLGTLLFAFSDFWMYLWFCQYWLIWYVNNPEETAYFVRRSHDWLSLSVLNLALNWGIPFCVLIFRSAKRNPWSLGSVAILVLAGRWLDLYLMVFPSQGSAPGGFGIIEMGVLIGAGGVFLITIQRTLARGPLDPATSQAVGVTLLLIAHTLTIRPLK